MLCKWEDHGHVNLGDGPPADAAAFLSAVQARLGLKLEQQESRFSAPGGAEAPGPDPGAEEGDPAREERRRTRRRRKAGPGLPNSDAPKEG